MKTLDECIRGMTSLALNGQSYDAKGVIRDSLTYLKGYQGVLPEYNKMKLDVTKGKINETKHNVNYHDDQRDSWYECPDCHATVNKCQKFCGECGQRLGWDMEEMGRC